MLNKFNTYTDNIDDELMGVYNNINGTNSNSKFDNISELNGIKIGDIVSFKRQNKILTGNVTRIFNEKYIIRGNFSGQIKEDMNILFDNIVEHYPKNINIKKDDELDLNENIFKPEPIYKKDPNITNNNKFVVLFPNETKQVIINEELSNNVNAKYFIVEKNQEIHVVKVKDGFQMKPFVESLISHLLKNNIIRENIKNMKIVGNDEFCILKDVPKSTNLLVKDQLKKLLK